MEFESREVYKLLDKLAVSESGDDADVGHSLPTADPAVAFLTSRSEARMLLLLLLVVVVMMVLLLLLLLLVVVVVVVCVCVLHLYHYKL